MPHRNQEPVRLSRQSGQATILMAGVVVIALLLAIALALIAQAMVHRARARTAADAVALASITNTDTARELAQRYGTQGLAVTSEPGYALASSGVSQAAAWAIADDQVPTQPALRAILARIEQLNGLTLVTVRWGKASFTLSGSEASIVQSMQAEFELCSQPEAGLWRFERC